MGRPAAQAARAPINPPFVRRPRRRAAAHCSASPAADFPFSNSRFCPGQFERKFLTDNLPQINRFVRSDLREGSKKPPACRLGHRRGAVSLRVPQPRAPPRRTQSLGVPPGSRPRAPPRLPPHSPWDCRPLAPAAPPGPGSLPPCHPRAWESRSPRIPAPPPGLGVPPPAPPRTWGSRAPPLAAPPESPCVSPRPEPGAPPWHLLRLTSAGGTSAYASVKWDAWRSPAVSAELRVSRFGQRSSLPLPTLVSKLQPAAGEASATG